MEAKRAPKRRSKRKGRKRVKLQIEFEADQANKTIYELKQTIQHFTCDMPSRVEVDGRVLSRDDATLAEEGLFGRGPVTVIGIFDPPAEELPPGGNRSMAYVKAHSSQEMAAHGAAGDHTDMPSEGTTLICATEDGDVPYDPKEFSAVFSHEKEILVDFEASPLGFSLKEQHGNVVIDVLRRTSPAYGWLASGDVLRSVGRSNVTHRTLAQIQSLVRKASQIASRERPQRMIFVRPLYRLVPIEGPARDAAPTPDAASVHSVDQPGAGTANEGSSASPRVALQPYTPNGNKLRAHIPPHVSSFEASAAGPSPSLTELERKRSGYSSHFQEWKEAELEPVRPSRSPSPSRSAKELEVQCTAMPFGVSFRNARRGQGVVVSSLREGSAAADVLQKGDVLKGVNGYDAASMDKQTVAKMLLPLLKEVSEEKPVTLKFLRPGSSQLRRTVSTATDSSQRSPKSGPSEVSGSPSSSRKSKAQTVAVRDASAEKFYIRKAADLPLKAGFSERIVELTYRSAPWGFEVGPVPGSDSGCLVSAVNDRTSTKAVLQVGDRVISIDGTDTCFARLQSVQRVLSSLQRRVAPSRPAVIAFRREVPLEEVARSAAIQAHAAKPAAPAPESDEEELPEETPKALEWVPLTPAGAMAGDKETGKKFTYNDVPVATASPPLPELDPGMTDADASIAVGPHRVTDLMGNLSVKEAQMHRSDPTSEQGEDLQFVPRRQQPPARGSSDDLDAYIQDKLDEAADSDDASDVTDDDDELAQDFKREGDWKGLGPNSLQKQDTADTTTDTAVPPAAAAAPPATAARPPSAPSRESTTRDSASQPSASPEAAAPASSKSPAPAPAPVPTKAVASSSPPAQQGPADSNDENVDWDAESQPENGSPTAPKLAADSAATLTPSPTPPSPAGADAHTLNRAGTSGSESQNAGLRASGQSSDQGEGSSPTSQASSQKQVLIRKGQLLIRPDSVGGAYLTLPLEAVPFGISLKNSPRGVVVNQLLKKSVCGKYLKPDDRLLSAGGVDVSAKSAADATKVLQKLAEGIRAGKERTITMSLYREVWLSKQQRQLQKKASRPSMDEKAVAAPKP